MTQPDTGLPSLDPPPDIRLIAADMDGTLLDDAKQIHDHFWPLVHELFRRGIHFCPASGRQYQTLHRIFGEVADELIYIAENGAYVVDGARELSADTLADDLVRRVVEAVRAHAAAGGDVGAVVSGKRAAYIERVDPAFRARVDQYYASQLVVEDLLARPDDEILKIAIHDFGPVETGMAPALAQFDGEATVVVSGEHWVDVMSPDADKGAAVRHVQAALGITAAQTMAFGDFPNDLEMMDAAEYSFAMDNAHPDLRARARYVAPPNSENGVVRTISAVLGLRWT